MIFGRESGPARFGLELSVALRAIDVDARFLEYAQVFRRAPRIDHVEGAVALIEAFLDEGQHHPILLVAAIEESADVPRAVGQRACEPDLLRGTGLGTDHADGRVAGTGGRLARLTDG